MVYGIKQCVCDKFSLSVGGITQKHNPVRTESFSVINTPCFTLCVHFNVKENFYCCYFCYI